MPLPNELNVGLKEWASVCGAMEEGRQILLLRKGGIHESAGAFELEHPQFLLFPTYVHQKLEMLKPAERSRFRATAEEPTVVRLSAAGEVTDTVQLRSRKQMQAIDDQHIWMPALIDMRFDYRPENPLYLLLVRVYRLARPITIMNTPQYAGCTSWVTLAESIPTGNVAPVMEDTGYEIHRRMILERVGAAAS